MLTKKFHCFWNMARTWSYYLTWIDIVCLLRRTRTPFWLSGHIIMLISSIYSRRYTAESSFLSDKMNENMWDNLEWSSSYCSLFRIKVELGKIRVIDEIKVIIFLCTNLYRTIEKNLLSNRVYRGCVFTLILKYSKSKQFHAISNILKILNNLEYFLRIRLRTKFYWYVIKIPR